MGNYYPLQSSFAGGELSPRLYGQANTERYHESLESMTNFIALPQGPAMRRQGFAYVDNALNNTDVRLLPFKVPGSADFVVELGPGSMGILSRANGREKFTTDELLINGDFAEGLLSWTDTAGAQSSGTHIATTKDIKRATVFTSETKPTTGLMRTLSQIIVTGATNNGVELSYSWAAYRRHLIGNFSDNTSVTVKVGNTPGGSEIYLATHTVSDADNLQNYDIFGNPIPTPAGVGTATIANFLGSARETVNINISTSDPIYLTYEFNILVDASGVPEVGYSFPLCWVEDITLGGDSVITETFTTPWETEADLALIQYVSESGGGRMYSVHPNQPPQILSLNAGSWLFGDMALINPPPSWSDSNWPSVIEFYQGRLWLAATPEDPSTIWASKSGDPFDFTIGIEDDDAFELPLSTTGGIKWLKGQKGMVIGTDIGEQVITSEGSLITPTDRKASKQSGWGSVDIQPSLAGNDIVYISQDRTKARAVNTNFSTGSWVSIDLTWVAEHITRGRIVESIYIQNPNYQLYFMLASGEIVACTYDREHEVIGWMRLVTSGEFLSITKTDSVEGTVLWAAIRRNNQIFIEAVDPEESVWQFTDSWVKEPVGTDGLVTGLDHLEGLTVQVLVDGAIEPDQVVVGGEITVLNTLGQTAVVGVEYEASMTTLPLGDGGKAGTALGSKRRYVRIFVQLFDSALPLINGQLPPDREPSTPMDTVQPNLTGLVQVRSLGREGGGRVNITQNLPKKTMVTAILGKASEEKT